MTKQEMQALQERIDKLPKGGITHRMINGKSYAYLQWRENGKQRSRTLSADEETVLIAQIEERKRLQAVLKEAEAAAVKTQGAAEGKAGRVSYDSEAPFRCLFRAGDELYRFALVTKEWKKRECFQRLHDYIYGNMTDRVFILYGLRRTGKTTMIRQLIADMDQDMFAKAVYIQASENLTLADINKDLRRFEKDGYRYVFIDEVTLLSDFIEGAALFSDIFASSGMKVVLSGTDSLGFLFSKDSQLYDRCVMLHTTFIPYREFERVLGISGIDDYIRYGGTMSMGGVHYNDKQLTFATRESTDEYVDSAIARNIQHSLRNYQYEGHFRSLRELYENNELTSAINRVVEDINHRFTIEVLTRDFRSNDLGISASNLRRDKHGGSDILDRIDLAAVTQTLKSLLEIRNRDEQRVSISDAHRQEIKEYLDLLDLTIDIELRNMANLNSIAQRTVFSQPGMRYSQAEALITSLMEDNEFRSLSLTERNRISERILSEIKGRMMEDIILLETKAARRNCQVFKLQFAVGEFDMVVFDPKSACCKIFEIKYSREILSEQRRHLSDEKKCADTEFRYGPIKGKYVIYRGESSIVEDVQYLNAEEYLKAL